MKHSFKMLLLVAHDIIKKYKENVQKKKKKLWNTNDAKAESVHRDS